MFKLPEKSGPGFIVTESDIKGWQRIYPNLDVEQEVGKMLQWLNANPRARKTNTHRFVVNWLAKSADSKPAQSTPHSVAYRAAVQQKHREEMAKPDADPEVARKALSEAMALLGIRTGN